MDAHEEPPLIEAIEWMCRALLVLALVHLGWSLLRLLWSYAQPWLTTNDKLAGWGQALGSVLAIAATAYIALAEARRATQHQQVQDRLQRESFAHQVSLQRQMLEHQKSTEREKLLREREYAIAMLTAVLDVLRRSAEALSPDLIPAVKRIYPPEIQTALSMIGRLSGAPFSSKAD